MARLYLFRDEVDVYTPPDMCMRCGACAETCATNSFSWSPAGSLSDSIVYKLLGPLGEILHIIMRIADTRRFKVQIPLCSRCSRRRIVYLRFVFCSVFSLLAAAVTGFRLLSLENEQRVLRDLAPPLLIGTGIVAVVLLCIVLILQANSIRPAEIKTSRIALIKVSPVFVNAVDTLRRNYPPELRQKISTVVWGHPHAYE